MTQNVPRLDQRQRARLIRILKLLGSDQPGERASAALAAQKLVTRLGLDWEQLLTPRAEPRVVVQKLHDWHPDERDAAESRIRQLKSTAEMQERQIRTLRTRINNLTEQARLRREAEAEREAADEAG